MRPPPLTCPAAAARIARSFVSFSIRCCPIVSCEARIARRGPVGRGVTAAALIALCSSYAAAQPTFHDATIVFPVVEAKTASSTGSPGLYWVVSGLEEAVVRTDDPLLKQQIEEWLARNHDVEHEWVLNVNTRWVLTNALFKDLQRGRVIEGIHRSSHRARFSRAADRSGAGRRPRFERVVVMAISSLR